MSGKSIRRSGSGRGSSHSRIQNNSHASTSVPLHEDIGSNSKPRGPKATAEQLRLAELLYPINSKDDANDAHLLASVRQLVECAGCTEDFAAMALHEAGGELERAAELLLDKDRPWNISSSAKAKKKIGVDDVVMGVTEDVCNTLLDNVTVNIGIGGGFQRDRTRHHDRNDKDNGSFRHDRRNGSTRSNSRNVPSSEHSTSHPVESNFHNGVESGEETAQRLPPRLTRGSRHAMGIASSRGRGRGRGGASVTHFRGKRNGNVSVAAALPATDALLWDDNLDLSLDADSEWTGQGSLTFTNSLHSAVASDAPINISPTPAIEILVDNSAQPLQPITTISSFGEPSDTVGGLQSPTGSGAIITSSVSVLSGLQHRNYNEHHLESKPQRTISSSNTFQELLSNKSELYSSQQPQMDNAMYAYKKLATEQLKNSLGIGELVGQNVPQAVSAVIPVSISLDPLSGAKSPVKSKPPPPSKIPRGPVEMPRRGILSTNGGSGLDFGFGDPVSQITTDNSKSSEKLPPLLQRDSVVVESMPTTSAVAAVADLIVTSVEVAQAPAQISEARINTPLGTSFSSKPSSVSSVGSTSILQINRSSLEESNASPSSSFVVAPASSLSLPLYAPSASISSGTSASAQNSYQTTPNKQTNYAASNQAANLYKMESSGLMGAYSAAGGSSSFKDMSESNSSNGYNTKSGSVSAAIPASSSQNDLQNSNVIINSSYQQQQHHHHHQVPKNIAPSLGNAGTAFHQTGPPQPTPIIHQQLYNTQNNPGLLGSMFPDGTANSGASQPFSFNQLFDMQNIMQTMYMHRIMQDAAMASGGMPSPQGQPSDSAPKQQDSRQQHSNNAISQQQHTSVTQHHHQQAQQQQQTFMNPQAGMYNYYGNTAYPYQFMSSMANLIQQQMQQTAPSQQTSGVGGQSLANNASVATNSPATTNKQNAFGYGGSGGVSGQVAYNSEDVSSDFKYGTKDLSTAQTVPTAQSYSKYNATHHNAHEKHATAGATTAVGMHPSISASGYGQTVSYGAHHYATMPPQMMPQSMLPTMQAPDSGNRNNMTGQVGGVSKSNLVKPSSGGSHALNAHNHYGGWTTYN